MIKQRVDEFVQTELREYAIYDNKRSIPSVVDGLKTSQRKIIHTVFQTLKEGVAIKTVSLGSASSNLTHYAHSEDSITDAVIGLAKDYAGSNNYPLLLKDGQFGTAQNNLSASPRYIHVKRDKRLDEMFDADDREIIEYLQYDGDDIEPLFFLPKLPILVINGSRGIGNGYATTILPRKISDVVDYIRHKVTGKGVAPALLPHFNGFTGEIVKLGERSFAIKGIFQRINLTQTVITDLPPDSAYQYEKYKENTLLKLLEARKINSIDNESNSRNGWKIIINHPREFGRLTDAKMMEALNLTKRSSETLVAWGFDKKLKTFDRVEEIVDYWIENRLLWLDARKKHRLSKMDVQLAWLENLIALTRYWIEHPDILKKKRPQIVEELNAICTDPEAIKRFLSSEILSLTEERIQKSLTECDKIRKEYQTLLAKQPSDILLDDLKSELFK